MRHLLIEDSLIRSWKLLQLAPRAPTIIAPRLRAENFGPQDFAVAGGGTVGGATIGNIQVSVGRGLSPDQVKAKYEQEKGDIEHPFSLADYKQSCAVYVKGQKVSRGQLVQYVANKKGGAHLDIKRKKDEQAYSALDGATDHPKFGGESNDKTGHKLPGKSPVYLELLSIGQNLTNAPDIKRFIEAAEAALASK